MIEIKGLNDVERQLQNLTDDLEKVEGTHEVPIDELLDSDFMTRFTRYPNFDEFVNASDFQVESQDDFDEIPESDWDRFVVENTQFDSWDDMITLAGQEFIQRLLPF